MALQPTALTSLLYGRDDVEEMVETLIANGCLTAEASAARKNVVKLVEDTMRTCRERYERYPGLCGPTPVDDVARALREASLLSEKGMRLDRTRPGITFRGKPWWRFWR